MRTLFWVSDFLLYSHVVAGARELCGISLVRALIPFRGTPVSWFNHAPQRPHLLGLSHWTLGFQYVNSRRTQTFRPQQAPNHTNLVCLNHWLEGGFLKEITPIRDLTQEHKWTPFKQGFILIRNKEPRSGLSQTKASLVYVVAQMTTLESIFNSPL